MQTLSMSVLAAGFYSPAEIGGFITHVGTMDDFLLHEGTYYVVEHNGEIVASGGWSRLRPNYANAAAGSAQIRSNQPKVRSVYVHPAFARRRLASKLMDLAEGEAKASGFDMIELTATLSGVPLYTQRGYRSAGDVTINLPGGLVFGAVMMQKPLAEDVPSAVAAGAVG